MEISMGRMRLFNINSAIAKKKQLKTFWGENSEMSFLVLSDLREMLVYSPSSLMSANVVINSTASHECITFYSW